MMDKVMVSAAARDVGPKYDVAQRKSEAFTGNPPIRVSGWPVPLGMAVG